MRTKTTPVGLLGFHAPTGSRGDVFVIRTSKPVENLLKNCVVLIALQFRYTFYIPQTKRLRARKIGLHRGYRLQLLIFKMTNIKVDLGQRRSEEIVYSRFIKIPLG